MTDKKIVIVGGGTAGWLSALFAQQNLPSTDITLIESDEIGILGAGEGSVPLFISFLQSLKIDILDLINKTNSTYKYGISFDNWNGPDTSYFHSFTGSTLDDNTTGRTTEIDHAYRAYMLSKGQNPFDLLLGKQLVDQNKSHFITAYQEGHRGATEIQPPVGKSIHFDARALAKYFREIAEQRGVVRIEGKITTVNTDSDGYITDLHLESGQTIDADFVIDCSGFARLVLGKTMGAEWQSYKEHLPAKAALPFFLPADEFIKPCTQSIAMKYGWMWKIPLQHRYGCGYVFDSDYIDYDQAKQEVEEFLGVEIDPPTKFKFEPGCFKENWIKNCVGVGLSAGFIEPLEATAIVVAVLQLLRLSDKAELIFTKQEAYKKTYNKIIRDLNEEIRDFIYFHYVTKRTDTEFWRDFTKNNKMPDSIRDAMEVWKDKPIVENGDFNGSAWMFGAVNWASVGYGLGNIITEENTSRLAALHPKILQIGAQQELRFKMNNNTILPQAIDQRAMMNIIKGH